MVWRDLSFNMILFVLSEPMSYVDNGHFFAKFGQILCLKWTMSWPLEQACGLWFGAGYVQSSHTSSSCMHRFKRKQGTSNSSVETMNTFA